MKIKNLHTFVISSKYISTFDQNVDNKVENYYHGKKLLVFAVFTKLEKKNGIPRIVTRIKHSHVHNLNER